MHCYAELAAYCLHTGCSINTIFINALDILQLSGERFLRQAAHCMAEHYESFYTRETYGKSISSV